MPRLSWVIPGERVSFARPLFKRQTVSRDGLFEARRPALSSAERQQGAAKIVLSDRPVGWQSLAGGKSESQTIRRDGLFEVRSSCLSLAERLQDVPKIVLDGRPSDRPSLARPRFHF